MASMIRPNRLEVSDRFPILGFTVHTGASPQWFEVALATDPKLFHAEAKAQRTQANFYSSHAQGPLPAERGDAVYLVPPEVLKRFAGQAKLYYGMATFSDPGRSKAEMVRMPAEGSPWVSLQSFTGRVSRRMMAIPQPHNGRAGNGNGYGARNADELMWAGDAARPGTEAIANAPAASAPTNGASTAPSTSAQPLTPPVAGPSASAAFEYDDGFGPMPLEATEARRMEEDYGIDAPIPDEAMPAQAMAYSRTFSVSEYPQASRFEQAKWYRTPSSPRQINRIVIHITDGGAKINGTIAWFKNPVEKDGTVRKVSAHYIVGQDGEVVQMVKHSDVAYHASSANSDSIGIEHNANTRGLNPTEAQYCSSAALVSWLCDQYGIPKDRTHIFGHSEADPKTTHTDCPNAVWDWDYYMGLVTSASCYPKPAATSSALGSDMPLNAKTNGRSSASKSPVYHRALGFAGIWREDIERLKTEFVANVQTGRKKKCIDITNASLRKFYGPNLQNSDGSDKRLGSTIQATMALLQSYDLAQTETIFEFNAVDGSLTKGVRRPDHLRTSVEAWLLNEADKNKTSTSYLFGLSIMDGYHSVILAVDFNGIGDPLTKIYWADQIYSGWDDVTGGLDARITSRTQGWWDPLAADKKARTRITVWPLNPGEQAHAVGQSATTWYSRSSNLEYGDDEKEPLVIATTQERTVSHVAIAQILEHVGASGLVEYSWKERGKAPIGYLNGMALTYARVYCGYTFPDRLPPGAPEGWRNRFAAKMAKGIAPGANVATDAIAKFENKLKEFGADVSVDGVDVLRGIFTILFGLGMRESGGKHCTGWDRGKLNGWGDPTDARVPTATNSEAGLFQISYDIGVGAPGDFNDLYERYKQRPTSGFLQFFSEGVICSTSNAENFGAGVGKEFQKFSKECPAFTVELAALALRTRANHWGPINRNTVELLPECWLLLKGVETAIDDLGGCVAVD